MMIWNVDPHHINLGPHNIHVNLFLITKYIVQHVTVENN